MNPKNEQLALARNIIAGMDRFWSGDIERLNFEAVLNVVLNAERLA